MKEKAAAREGEVSGYWDVQEVSKWVTTYL